jgi:putative tricarboxylic transport membrane protein
MDRPPHALARGLALLLAAIGALAALEAWRAMPLGAGDEPGPGLMPLVLAALLAGLALAAAASREWPRPGPLARARMLAAAAVIAAWPLALPRLGFALTTGLGLLLLGRVVDDKPWGRLAVFAAVTTAGAVVLFRVVLRVPLPRGPWGF